MLQIEDVLRDRGSRYAVTGGRVQGRAGAAAFVQDLKRVKKFAKATIILGPRFWMQRPSRSMMARRGRVPSS